MIIRALVPFFLVGALVVACSGDAGAPVGDYNGGASSGAAGTSGRSSGGRTVGGSSGVYPPSENGSSSSASSSGALLGGVGSVDAILAIRVGESVCGGSPGCNDAQTFTVDFAASKMTTTTCVELAGHEDAGPTSGETQNVDTSHALSADNLASIKKALSAVRTNTNPVSGFDGPQWILEVTTKNGTTLYAATSGCGPQDKMIQIESGWTELWTLLERM